MTNLYAIGHRDGWRSALQNAKANSQIFGLTKSALVFTTPQAAREWLQATTRYRGHPQDDYTIWEVAMAPIRPSGYGPYRLLVGAQILGEASEGEVVAS